VRYSCEPGKNILEVLIISSLIPVVLCSEFANANENLNLLVLRSF
jgi:hypothetical protein